MQKSHVNVTIQLSIDLDHKTNLFLTEISSISWRPSTTSESISDDDEKKSILKTDYFLLKKSHKPRSTSTRSKHLFFKLS